MALTIWFKSLAAGAALPGRPVSITDNWCPVVIVEDDFDRVVEPEFKGSLIGGESDLISCFHKIPPATWSILPCSWGWRNKREAERPWI
jgi:hypothetical protein